MDTRQTSNRTAIRQLALALLLAAAPVALVACSSTVGGNSDGADDDGADGADGDGADGGDGDGDEPLPGPESVDAVDVLLVVDGSGSMADKQVFLAQSFRPFLERLRSPRCIDGAGDAVDAQPATPTDPCPAGSVREYTPDVTVHVGVVSSSLGTGGSPLCAPTPERLNDDAGRLVARSPGSTTNDIPTYRNLGFFAWDPAGRLAPVPGDADFEQFAGNVEDAIRGVGEIGCGFEMPLEAMFRFLAEPHPVEDDGDDADDVLLAQRAAFLRPDSVLSVILLSDENDASIRPEMLPLAASTPGETPMPRPRAECAANPADACCVSCIEPVPAGCSGDGGCAAPGDQSDSGNYWDTPVDGSPDENSIFLRTWDSKRRFGIEFMHPIGRYVGALTSPTVIDSLGAEVPNPVFADGRPAHRVHYTAIVGVPWQLLTVVPGEMSEGFQSPSQMRDRGTWDVIAGDPAAYVPATDPHMIESPLPRPGIVAYPGNIDPINGGERDTGYQDLQYACIFDLPASSTRDCADPMNGCDCAAGTIDNPLCDAGDPMLQIRAKAYPGLRQLAVAEALADQGRVVPMCAPLLLPGDEGVPGENVTLNLEIGLGSIADDVASRMHE